MKGGILRSAGLIARAIPMIASLDTALIDRVRGEFLEMPGLRLTFQQARRLWGLDEETCACLLEALVVSGFLVHGDDEQYARAFDGEPLTRWSDGPRSAGRQRQPQSHDRPTSLWGLDGNPATVGFDQPLHS